MTSPQRVRRPGYAPTNPAVGRRGMHTREQIVARAGQLFVEHSYHGTSIDAIAKAVGGSRATIYQYFESKDDIFRELIRQCEPAVLEHAARLGRLSPEAAGVRSLHRWLTEWAQLYDKYAMVFLEFPGIGAIEGLPQTEAGAVSGRPAPVSDDEFLGRFNVRPPYVLFVGTLEPRKAVPDLVAAFDRVAAQRPELSLVLVGQPGWGAEAVEQAVRQARAAHRIVRTGYVPDDAVPALLRRAAVAAYPSYEEGFGLPALEALACGTPLVTTSGTTMAEVSGGAAVLVAPGSVSELSDALAEVLDGGAAVDARRRRGLEVAAHHTWAASAADHMSAYRWAARRTATSPPGSSPGSPRGPSPGSSPPGARSGPR